MNSFVTVLVLEKLDLRLAAAGWRLGLLDPAVAPLIAQEAMVRGVDSEAITLLAGQIKPKRRDDGDLIDRALMEVFGELPSEKEAVQRVSAGVAQAIVGGTDEQVLRLIREGVSLARVLAGDLPGDSLLYLLDQVADGMSWDPPHRLTVDAAIAEARRESRRWLQGNMRDGSA